jgi:hypothetical protein
MTAVGVTLVIGARPAERRLIICRRDQISSLGAGNPAPLPFFERKFTEELFTCRFNPHSPVEAAIFYSEEAKPGHTS